MTTPMSASMSLNRFVADLAVKARMMTRGLNRIFIAHAVPRELQSPNRLQAGAVRGLILPQSGLTAASGIGEWPDSAAVKNQLPAALVLEIAVANARICAEAPGRRLSPPRDLSPHPVAQLRPLVTTREELAQPAAAVVRKDSQAFLKAAPFAASPKMPLTLQARVKPPPHLR